MIRFRLILCSLVLLTSTFSFAAVNCWVSLEPEGEAVTWISSNSPLSDSRSVSWLNATIAPTSTRATFTLSYVGATIDQKHIHKFVNPPELISIPLFFAYTGFIGGPESVITFGAKDDFAKCATTVEYSYNAYESTDIPKDVPDLGNVQSTIEINGIDVIQRVRVAIWLQHTYLGDLEVSLMGPDGTIVNLTSDNGGSAEDIGLGCTRRVYFDDEASNSITAAVGTFVGLYQPETPLSAFAGKTGNDANGTWTLMIVDDQGNDVGELMAWSIATDEI